jgi:hypothetical protein
VAITVRCGICGTPMTMGTPCPKCSQGKPASPPAPAPSGVPSGQPLILFGCPHCRQEIRVAATAAGRQGKCPHCKAPIMVPGGATAQIASAVVPTLPATLAPLPATPIPKADISAPSVMASLGRGILLRLPPPVFLLLIVVLFFLPWTELQCNGNSYTTQSGFQSCYGGSTLTLRVTKNMQKAIDEDNAKSNQDRDAPSLVAPLMILFPLMVVFGLGVSVLLPLSALLPATGTRWATLFSGPIHALLLLAVAGLCLFLLIVQHLSGFPFDRRLDYAYKQLERREPSVDPEFQQSIETSGAMALNAVKVRYTGYFWLTVLLLITAFFWSLADVALATIAMFGKTVREPSG